MSWYNGHDVGDGLFRRGSAFLSALDTTTTFRIAHQKAVGSHALLSGPMCFLGNLKIKELYQRESEQLLS